MQNKLSNDSAELEKDRCKGVDIRELNDTEKFTSKFLSVGLNSITKFTKYVYWGLGGGGGGSNEVSQKHQSSIKSSVVFIHSRMH